MHITGNILLTLFRNPVLVACPVMAGCGAWLWGWWGLLAGVSPVVFLFTYWLASVWLTSEVRTVRAVWNGIWKMHKVREMWPHVMREVGMIGKSGDVAPYGDPHIIRNGVKVKVITGSIAKHSSGLQKKAPDIAAGFFAARAIVKTVAPAIAELTLQWGHHLRQKYGIYDLPPATSPDRVVFGITESGMPAELAYNLSVLAGGLTGSGKSSFVWSVIAGYIRAGIPIRLRVLDPSEVEFSELNKAADSPIVLDYLGGISQEAREKFFERIRKDMKRRMRSVVESGVREHVPTVEEPLDITIIDELLPIAVELRKGGTEHPIAEVAFLGRKAGFLVIALTQAAQVDTIGRVRDLFAQRVSFKTQNRHLTDAVLNDGAESDGARCSLLDIHHDKGVGYMASRDGGYQQIRTAYVDNKELPALAMGRLPVPAAHSEQAHATRMSKPHVLYAFFGADGGWLYVGMTVEGRHETRWAEHSREKPWWSEVADKQVIDHLPDGYLAETAEALAIRKYKPKYNKTHNKKNPDRVHVPSQRGL